ncbi:hypothetical protein JOF41_006982 [Saccharothrix coeruleofusca]|uniref:hypothetical protein n=1 Tax=Saccharothrix coeruleofusca TaxID=33919 RepID=UPI001AE3F20B|nr:hypothetical protein [Saccharothrix coeruleofusca]MBP2340804.1 hypothetical protein [Saccharothrix coeruleofusca]
MTAPPERNAAEPDGVLGPGWPGWVLRAAVVAVGAAVAGVLSANGVAPLVLGLYLVLVGVAAAIPASAASALAIAYPAAAVVLAGGPPVRPGVLALVVLLHLLHVLCGYAALLPARSRVHPFALKKPAVRFLSVQLAVLTLAGMITLLPVSRTAPAVEVVGLLAAVGLVVAAVLLMRRKG